jgi:hypothetical protein
MIFSIQQTISPGIETGTPSSPGMTFFSRPAHEEEVDLQEAFEDNNYYKALDPEDFATDRGWWYRCRHCDQHTRVRSKAPYCRQCGFSQTTKGVL